MKISLKNYQKIRLIFVVIIAFIISQSIVFENYIIPIFVMIIWSLILFFLRSKVTEIIADERDYTLAWKSAIYSIQIFSWVLVISMFIFYYFKNINPVFDIIAQTLGFSICILMLLYSFIFSFLSREWKFDKKLIFYTFFLVFLIWFFISIFLVNIFYQNNKNISTKIIEKNTYKIEKTLDISCKIDNDCKTPGEYLIRSNCPYTSKCIKNKCNVICPNPYQ